MNFYNVFYFLVGCTRRWHLSQPLHLDWVICITLLSLEKNQNLRMKRTKIADFIENLIEFEWS